MGTIRGGIHLVIVDQAFMKMEMRGDVKMKEAAAKGGGPGKTTPPLPWRTRSLEHVLLHVERAGLFSASNQGMPAAVSACSVIVFTTVQGLLRITCRAG